MARGVSVFSTIVNPDGKCNWDKFSYPTFDPDMIGQGERWFAARNKPDKPFCFTPAKHFWFGGKRFIPLYPCQAFATRNFGFIYQRLWDRVIVGAE